MHSFSSFFHSLFLFLFGKQQFGQRHRDLGEEMEKVGGMRMPGEGEIPAGMEEQDDYTTSVHAAGVEAR